MPLKFWDEAFLTTTFLINLLPSKVIHNETPVERLLKVKPNYDSLRIFGCACWPNLRPYMKRKLAYRSTRCVFLGYSPLHKGVKCLDVTSGCVYIYRDVVFDENVFPFASLHPNAGRRLTQDILLLPSSNNACTHGDTQFVDHMPLPVIPVVTNPAKDHTPQIAEEDHAFEDDHTGTNLTENDEEMSENSSSSDAAEEDNASSGSEADSLAASIPDGADPGGGFSCSQSACRPYRAATTCGAAAPCTPAMRSGSTPRLHASPVSVTGLASHQCADIILFAAPADASDPVATWSGQVPAR
jgi:hypothetical protein